MERQKKLENIEKMERKRKAEKLFETWKETKQKSPGEKTTLTQRYFTLSRNLYAWFFVISPLINADGNPRVETVLLNALPGANRNLECFPIRTLPLSS